MFYINDREWFAKLRRFHRQFAHLSFVVDFSPITRSSKKSARMATLAETQSWPARTATILAINPG
jgi:hypothetical protein